MTAGALTRESKKIRKLSETIIIGKNSINIAMCFFIFIIICTNETMKWKVNDINSMQLILSVYNYRNKII